MLRRRAGVSSWVVVLVVGLACEGARGESFVFQHDNVLGTSCELLIEARDLAAARAAEQAALAEVDRMAAVVSTYTPTSEVSGWLGQGRPHAVSDDLAAILRACDHWREVSGGAFHPGVATATAIWRRAEANGAVPTSADLQAVASTLQAAPWQWDGELVAPAEGQAISLDGLAKGAIIDAAAAAARAVVGVDGIVLTIGGDMAAVGNVREEVAVTGPRGETLDMVTLSQGALATSGGRHRGFTVGGQHLSHIIDPRTARPVEHVASASVLAATAADADALATLCCVLDVAESLVLIDSIADAECLIVDQDGGEHASQGWAGRAHGRRRTVATSVAFTRQPAQAFELVLDLEINRPEGGRYRRPYVAAWVEDADGYPVKTLLLWVQTDGPGPRWIPDLRRWHRADRLRQLAEDTDLVATVSEPTRQPGQHGVTWDGTDNAGAILAPGEYTICIEAAREHGTYQFDRRTVALGEKPFRETFDSNPEIKSATLEYRAVGKP